MKFFCPSIFLKYPDIESNLHFYYIRSMFQKRLLFLHLMLWNSLSIKGHKSKKSKYTLVSSMPWVCFQTFLNMWILIRLRFATPMKYVKECSVRESMLHNSQSIMQYNWYDYNDYIKSSEMCENKIRLLSWQELKQVLLSFHDLVVFSITLFFFFKYNTYVTRTYIDIIQSSGYRRAQVKPLIRTVIWE